MAETASTAPPRWGGLDVARALATAGMVVAHLWRPDGLLGTLTAGLPSALFALLAGVGVGFLGDGPARAGGAALARSRHALVVRGCLLVAAGLALEPASADVVVVLGAIGAATVVLSGAPAWSTTTLARLLAGLVAASALVHTLALTTGVPVPPLVGVYPLAAWTAYLLAGLLVHRHLDRLARDAVPVALVGTGVTIAGVAGRPAGDAYGLTFAPPWVRGPLDPTPHTGGLLDVVTCLAAALAAVALCLLVVRALAPTPLRVALLPVERLGRMSLTAYVLHVVTAGVVLTRHPGGGHVVATAVTLAVGLVLAGVHGATHRRGPLEALLRDAVLAATHTRRPPRRD